MNNILDIQLGGLYHIPHYTTPIFDFIDPTTRSKKLSCDILPGDTPFVPLEIVVVRLNNHFFSNNETVFYRVKILAGTGMMGWLSLQDKDLQYIFRMTSCDK